MFSYSYYLPSPPKVIQLTSITAEATTTMTTEKDCGDHGGHRKLCRRTCIGILIFIITLLLVIFLIWLLLRPTKPKFILQDATLYSLNVSSLNVMTSIMQVTVSSRNPNDRISIYYKRIDVYAAYRGQEITFPTLIPKTYQGHKEISLWSPFLNGEAVPVSPSLAAALREDQFNGLVLLNIKIQGSIKWKVGTWVSGKYHLDVNCPAYISYGDANMGIQLGPAIKYQYVMACHVDV